MNPSGTCSPCPGGEDHLKRRSSSPPVPPLLGWRHCPKKGGSVCFAPKHKFPSALGACLAGTISAAGGLMPGCRGRSPRQNKLLVPPLPAGKGAGGIGAGKQAEGRVGGRLPPFALRRAPQRQGQPVRQGRAPPPGTERLHAAKKCAVVGQIFKYLLTGRQKGAIMFPPLRRAFLLCPGTCATSRTPCRPRGRYTVLAPATRRRGQIF